MRWKECFSKPPQTPISPPHLLGNDQERGVSVCSLIKNRWLVSAASLLVIGDMRRGGQRSCRGSRWGRRYQGQVWEWDTGQRIETQVAWTIQGP